MFAGINRCLDQRRPPHLSATTGPSSARQPTAVHAFSEEHDTPTSSTFAFRPAIGCLLQPSPAGSADANPAAANRATTPTRTPAPRHSAISQILKAQADKPTITARCRIGLTATLSRVDRCGSE